MSQTSTYKIDGQTRTPFRNASELRFNVVFGYQNTPDIKLDNVVFTNSTEHNNHDFVKGKWQQQPLEGIDVDVNIADTSGNSIDFKLFADWNKLVFNASNELSLGLKKDNSVLSFEERAKAITFGLLEFKDVLNIPDYQNIPYIVENRKTLLEKIQLLVQTWTTFKSAIDEVHKIINIASDITTLGIAQAIINLAVTVANLILLIQRLIDLFLQIQEAFFPIVLYHSGIKPKVFIEKAVEYLGYSGVEFGDVFTGSFGWIMERLTWCPSKNNEKGIPINILNPVLGSLRPNDKGYNLFDALQILKDKYTTRVGIVDNVVHIRPENDPYWELNPGSTLPDVLVETSILVQNGTSRPNYDLFYSNTIIQYARDSSDLWSLEDLVDPSDPNSAGKIIAGVVVEPLSVNNEKRIISQQGKVIDLPHTLCNRKDVVDDLLDTFLGTSSALNDMKQMIKDRFIEFATDLQQAFPLLGDFVVNVGGRSGAMKVENHFFSVAKCVFLEDVDLGFQIVPRIPANFADYIGARSLIDNWHNYNSFVPGIRNPNDINDTNAKIVFEDVKIPFNLEKFIQVVNNPYFSVINGGVGKYISVDWQNESDTAVVSYWIKEPWMQNVEQTKI
jgi:hypothetical protein